MGQVITKKYDLLILGEVGKAQPEQVTCGLTARDRLFSPVPVHVPSLSGVVYQAIGTGLLIALSYHGRYEGEAFI